MKKELAKKMAQFQEIDINRVDEIEKVSEDVVSDSELDKVLKEIFSVDPNTGFPRGDIAYYLSSDGNPTIKAWLENNLLRPRAVGGQSLEGVTDDLIEEMSRRPDESVGSYSERLQSLYDESVTLLNQYQENLKSD